MTIKELQKRSASLYNDLEIEVGGSTLDLIKELIEVEVQLELESNK